VRAPRARASPRGWRAPRSSADGSSSSASAPASPPGSPPDSRPPSPRPGAGGGVPPTEAALGAARAAAGAAPLFFLHGVGLGLVRGRRLWRAPECRRLY